MATLLEVQGLKKYFPVTKGLLFPKAVGWVRAVDGVDFMISEGSTFALVGESGCGKTTTGNLILLLEEPTEGCIRFRGNGVNTTDAEQLREYQRSVQAVFQDPQSSLSPRMRIRDFISEPLEVHHKLPKNELMERVLKLLEQVGLHHEAANSYPHEFSGGQRQRIAVARALALNPALIVLDEPVSSLDVSIGAQIMNLLKDLQDQLGLAYLLIAHNLATVRFMSQQVGVMYLGKIMERTEAVELYSHPVHPYTKALLAAALPSHPDVPRSSVPVSGEPPSPISPPPGCRFHTRCIYARPICREQEPPLREVSSGHFVACHHPS